METKQKTTLTQGSVARGMLLFALPIFISNLFQQLYNAADSLIVGNFLGGEALAAVGSSGSLIFLLTGFVNGVSLGAGVVVARYFGAKDWDRMRRTIHTTVALGLVAGVGLVRNQAVDNQISVEDVRERIRENFPLAAPRFEEALAETGVQENDRVTVTPARIKKLESRSFKTESGIEIRIPAELCSSDDAVEFIHSATGGLSLLIKDVLV